MLSGSSYIPPFYFYEFAQAISGPYTALDAYKAGAIDDQGNIIKPESSIDSFEYLVIKLKKIFELIPSNLTKAKLASYFSTLQLFQEEYEEYDLDPLYLNMLIEGHITNISNGEVSYLELVEDMASGNLGGPSVQANPDSANVAGFDPPLTDKILKRKYLNNCEIFDVCPEEFTQFKQGKSWKDIQDSPTKSYLQRFQRRSNTKMAVRTVNPESGDQYLHWINYPAKNFLEEYNLNIKKFNLE
jgi:hypothetical protein